MTEWFEQDSFWETFGEFMFDTQRVGVARSEVDRMIDLMHLAPSAKVLDLYCAACLTDGRGSRRTGSCSTGTRAANRVSFCASIPARS